MFGMLKKFLMMKTKRTQQQFCVLFVVVVVVVGVVVLFLLLGWSLCDVMCTSCVGATYYFPLPLMQYFSLFYWFSDGCLGVQSFLYLLACYFSFARSLSILMCFSSMCIGPFNIRFIFYFFSLRYLFLLMCVYLPFMLKIQCKCSWYFISIFSHRYWYRKLPNIKHPVIVSLFNICVHTQTEREKKTLNFEQFILKLIHWNATDSN